MIPSDKDRPITLYCADCRMQIDRFGASHDGHLVASAAGHVGKRWLWVRGWLRDWEHKYSPSARLRKWKWTKKYFSDSGPWLALRLVLLIVGLLLSATNAPLKIVVCLVAAYLVFDVVVTNLSIAFVTRAPADAVRSVLLATFSFMHLAVAFAVFYVATGTLIHPTNPVSMLDALFFSWTVATTVGLDDVKPNGHLGKLIVSSQLLMSLLFLATILQVMVNWLGQSRDATSRSHGTIDAESKRSKLCYRIAKANARRPRSKLV